MKATLNQTFLDSVISINRYVSVINGVNLDRKKIVFLFKKSGDSSLYYISNGLFAKASLGSLSCDEDANYEVDYEKFLHLVQNSNGDLVIEVTDSTMKVTTDVAIVDLLCSKIEEKDPTMDIVNVFKVSDYSENISLSENVIAGMAMTNSLIALSKNNAGSIFDNKVMYSDRSQIYTKDLVTKSNVGICDDGLILHKNIFSVLTNFFKFNKNDLTQVLLKKKPKTSDSFVISDNSMELFISNAQAEVSLPTEDDLKSICPTHHSFSLSKEALDELVAFFSGFFVGNSWKPLTFVNKDGELEVEYSVPSVTNISRKVGPLNPGSAWTKFVIDSDSIKNFVSKLQGEFEFYVEEKKIGILVKNGTDNIVFAKLV